jgi:hypothetical protein
MLSLMLLLVILAAIQSSSMVNLRVLGRLQNDIRQNVSSDSLRERLRGMLASAMTMDEGGSDDLSLQSEPVLIQEDGTEWQLKLQDVEGLVDLYLSPEAVLDLLPLGGREVLSGRESLAANFGLGTRFPTQESSLAQFGLVSGGEDGLTALVTQSASFAGLRIERVPERMFPEASRLPAVFQFPGQTRKVVVSLSPVP